MATIQSFAGQLVLTDPIYPEIIRTQPLFSASKVVPGIVFRIEVADNNAINLDSLSLIVLEPEERVIFDGSNVRDVAVISGSGQYYTLDFRLGFDPIPEVLYRMAFSAADYSGNVVADEFTITFLRNLPPFNRSVSIFDYDLGREGIVDDLTFTASGLAKFRVKITDTIPELETVLYDGLTDDRFESPSLNENFWRIISTSYNIVQANATLTMSGTRIGLEGSWGAPAEIQSIWPIGYSFDTSVDIQLQNLNDTTGAMAFLAIEDPTTRIEIQKFYQKIQYSVGDYLATDGQGRIGKNVIVGESAELRINDTLHPEIDVSGLTSGIAGTIDTDIIYPEQIDTFLNLKQTSSIAGIVNEANIDEDYVRIFKVFGDSNIEGSTAPVPISYIIDRDVNNNQIARTVVTSPLIDSQRQHISSLNLDTTQGGYITAEVNDQWTTTLLLPLGTYRYKFWVDGVEVPDANNLNRGEDAVGEYSILELDRATQVTFVHNAKATKVAVVGTFNQYNPLVNPMEIGADITPISQIFTLGDNTYINDHRDFHKVEIEFDEPVSLSHILFKTGVVAGDLQRVRVLLDDKPIHKSDWTVSSEDVARTSFFENSSDIFISEDDGFFKWEPNEDIANKRYAKFALVTRLENGTNFTRQHEYLELKGGIGVTGIVTDYGFLNQRESEYTITRSTIVNTDGSFTIPDVVVQEGDNILTLSASDTESSVVGETAELEVTQAKSLVRQFDQSEFSTGNIEYTLGLSGNLSKSHSQITEVIDDSTLNPFHIVDEGESEEPLSYEVIQRGDTVLAQILRPIYSARLFGRVIDIDAPIGDTTAIYIEKTFVLLNGNNIQVDEQTYPVVNSLFYHAFLDAPARVLDIEEFTTEFKVTIDKAFISPIITEPDYYGYGVNEMPFGWALNLSNRLGLVTDYVIHPDGQIDCLNESGLATGEVQVRYSTTGVFISTPSENMTTIPTAPNDVVRIVIEPINNRVTLSEFHHLEVMFFDDGETVLMPTQVTFRLNDTYEFTQNRPRLINEITADDGIPDRLMLFEGFAGNIFGKTQFPSEYNAETNPTIDKIEVEFVAPSTEIKINEFRFVGISVERNVVMRIVVNDREVFTLDQSINQGRFDQFKISAERDNFEVFFNDRSYYRQSLTLNLPKASLGVRAYQNGDTVKAIFDNFQATRYFDSKPISLRLKGRYLRTEATLVEDGIR